MTTLTAPLLGRYGYLTDDCPIPEPPSYEEDIIWEHNAQAAPE